MVAVMAKRTQPMTLDEARAILHRWRERKPDERPLVLGCRQAPCQRLGRPARTDPQKTLRAALGVARPWPWRDIAVSARVAFTEHCWERGRRSSRAYAVRLQEADRATMLATRVHGFSVSSGRGVFSHDLLEPRVGKT
jgi:hypothetical protein